jgi:hypothetical protein
VRIAVGLDGVFADLNQALARLSVQIFQTRLQDLSPRQERLLWRVIAASDDFWQQLDECEPGAVATLARLARERDWEVIFLVRRIPTCGSSPQVQSQNWLTGHGFDLPAVYVINSPIDAVARALNLDVILDSPSPEGPMASLKQICKLDDRKTSWRVRRSRSRKARRLRAKTIPSSHTTLRLA